MQVLRRGQADQAADQPQQPVGRVQLESEWWPVLILGNFGENSYRNYVTEATCKYAVDRAAFIFNSLAAGSHSRLVGFSKKKKLFRARGRTLYRSIASD